MGILSFNDALKEWDQFHRPWEVGSWSDKINNAEFGSPFHGLRAGKTIWELMSPTVHMNDRVQDIKKNGTDGHIGRSREQFHDYTKEAWDNNWPVAAAFLGGWAGGAGGGGAAGGASGGSTAGSGGLLSAGDAAALDAASASSAMNGTAGVTSTSGMGFGTPAASSGINWGAVQSGAGLLGQAAGGGQQQQGGAAAAPPPQKQPNDSLQRRLAAQKRIQQLRMKPRKSLAEQQELQELMRNQTGQM
jgi:hypothetical protein